MLGCVYWWSRGGGVEAVIVFLAALGAFIRQEFNSFGSEQLLTKRTAEAEASERKREKDAKLFDELIRLINPDELYFLKNHDHGDAYRNSDLKGTNEFVGIWNHVEREFLDPQLEALRRGFYESAQEYIGKAALYTFGDRYGVRSLSQHLFDHDERRWYAQQDELNGLATNAATAYENLIRAGRSNL